MNNCTSVYRSEMWPHKLRSSYNKLSVSTVERKALVNNIPVTTVYSVMVSFTMRRLWDRFLSDSVANEMASQLWRRQ